MNEGNKASTITPSLVSEMLDNLCGDDPSSIIAASLSVLTGHQVRCEVISGGIQCNLYTDITIEKCLQELHDFVMSIQTIDDDGNYTQESYRFFSCSVYVLTKHIDRTVA